jgi:flavin reductase (DIM6/NTAB) family NADH-FMN oxidoreductase RutF
MAASEMNGVRPADFRELMSRFPTGVAVVTAIDGRGEPQGMTCSSLASVCMEPPTLLVSLRTTSATCAAVRACGTFAINLLHRDGRHAAEVFSTPRTDRFETVHWRGTANGLPWLHTDSAAVADCEVVETKVVGDHTVVFGEVRGLDLAEGWPLLYGMRAFSGWPEAAADRSA